MSEEVTIPELLKETERLKLLSTVRYPALILKLECQVHAKSISFAELTLDVQDAQVALIGLFVKCAASRTCIPVRCSF